MTPLTIPPRARIWIAAMLACAAAGLLLVNLLSGPADAPVIHRLMPRGTLRAEAGSIQSRVGAVAAQFSVPENAIRTVAPQRSEPGPREVRLRVGPDFPSYEFQSALAAALADMDVAVTGTENMRQKTTILHVVRDSTTMVSVVLDMRTVPQQPRKESSH